MSQDQQTAASSPAPFPASAEVERRAEEEGPDRRQSVVDRRTGIDRRAECRSFGLWVLMPGGRGTPHQHWPGAPPRPWAAARITAKRPRKAK